LTGKRGVRGKRVSKKERRVRLISLTCSGTGVGRKNGETEKKNLKIALAWGTPGKEVKGEKERREEKAGEKRSMIFDG